MWAVIEKVQPSCSVRHKQKSLLIPLPSVSKKPSEIGDKTNDNNNNDNNKNSTLMTYTIEILIYGDLIGQDLCSIVLNHTLTVVGALSSHISQV